MSSARPDTWMPVYWGDYARDTGHLSALHHGAYLMLIKHYWCTGAPLPDDDALLWRIACCEGPAQWRKIRTVIASMFKVDDGVWRHGRVDEELANAEGRTTGRSKAGKAGARALWKKRRADANVMPEAMTDTQQTDAIAMRLPSDCHWQNDGQSQPQPQPQEAPLRYASGARRRESWLAKLPPEVASARAACYAALEAEFPGISTEEPGLAGTAGLIDDWIATADLVSDVLPAIKGRCMSLARKGDRPKSWAIFADAVARNAQRRKAGLPPSEEGRPIKVRATVEATVLLTRHRLETQFRAGHPWPSWAGPPPDDPGYAAEAARIDAEKVNREMAA